MSGERKRIGYSSATLLKRVYLIASVAITAAVVGYAVWSAGRVTSAVIFLGIAAVVLELALWILFRAAAALVRDPIESEVAVATGRRRKELEREKQLLLVRPRDGQGVRCRFPGDRRPVSGPGDARPAPARSIGRRLPLHGGERARHAAQGRARAHQA